MFEFQMKNSPEKSSELFRLIFQKQKHFKSSKFARRKFRKTLKFFWIFSSNSWTFQIQNILFFIIILYFKEISEINLKISQFFDGILFTLQ